MKDDLPKGLAAGDAAAYQQTYDLYGPALFGAALRILASAPDAEDALQDVFVSLVRNRDRLAQVGNMKAYLFASLRHAAGRILRRRQHTAATELEAAISTAALSSDDRCQSDRLWALAAGLPAVQLEVLALRIQGELTFKEIADICGISLNTAASRYRYALEKLKLMVERKT